MHSLSILQGKQCHFYFREEDAEEAQTCTLGSMGPMCLSSSCWVWSCPFFPPEPVGYQIRSGERGGDDVETLKTEAKPLALALWSRVLMSDIEISRHTPFPSVIHPACDTFPLLGLYGLKIIVRAEGPECLWGAPTCAPYPLHGEIPEPARDWCFNSNSSRCHIKKTTETVFSVCASMPLCMVCNTVKSPESKCA